LYNYLKHESLVEAQIMLIVNYLVALLINSQNNKISIYKNFKNKMDDIQLFTDNTN